MAKPIDVTFHNIHGFCHGTMAKAITWQNPYTMTFAMVYGFCHIQRVLPLDTLFRPRLAVQCVPLTLVLCASALLWCACVLLYTIGIARRTNDRGLAMSRPQPLLTSSASLSSFVVCLGFQDFQGALKLWFMHDTPKTKSPHTLELNKIDWTFRLAALISILLGCSSMC